MAKALIIVDHGKVGTRKQAEVLCEALKLTCDTLEIDCAWKGWLLPAGKLLRNIFERTQASSYTTVVSAGRRSAIWGLRYARICGARSYHVMDPGWLLRPRFDVVIVPEHDGVQGANVITIEGALVKPDWENCIKREDVKTYVDPQKPTLALIIGGSTPHYQFTDAVVTKLAHDLDCILATTPMNVLITFSRRTDAHVKAALHKWSQQRHAYVWDGSEPNPYGQFLSVADYLLVTQDSIGMISDACYTGKPTYVVRLAGSYEKFDRFTGSLLQNDRIRWFDGRLEIWKYPPLREFERLAKLMKTDLL